ncbi:MAG TPA: hypothetical protein VKV26_19715 [Dehalococcoidia bacterium]|nr:hypothetical protein [Dehalococcoidia bacterium]
MGLNERIGRLLGRRSAPSATLAADRARQQQMHGQETGQTDQERAAMRQRMEADVDAQRAERAEHAQTDA